MEWQLGLLRALLHEAVLPQNTTISKVVGRATQNFQHLPSVLGIAKSKNDYCEDSNSRHIKKHNNRNSNNNNRDKSA